MTEEKDLIRIRWSVDRSQETPVYRLICENKEEEYSDLEVHVSSEEMSERVAKAKLMQQMYELGKERGIPARRLRFKINGIEE